MTPREFREECELGYNDFQELTSTGIKPNYDNIERFAEEYHQAKLKLLDTDDVVRNSPDNHLVEIAVPINSLILTTNATKHYNRKLFKEWTKAFFNDDVDFA